MRRQGHEPRTRGLRVRFIPLYEVSAVLRNAACCWFIHVTASARAGACRVLYGQYHGIRANDEQTSMGGRLLGARKIEPGPGPRSRRCRIAVGQSREQLSRFSLPR